MSIVADFTIPASQFALGETLTAVPEANVEFERIVTHSQEWVMPFLWVRGDDLDAFDEALRADSSVESATLTDDFGDVVLYQLKWSDAVTETINAIFDRAGTLIEASGSAESWDITVRFDDHSSVSDLQDHFEEGDLDFTLRRLYEPTEPRHPEYRLTPDQRQTLVLAVEQGYFDVPRRVKVAELADELELSSTSVSERLRRGTRNLVDDALTVGSGGEGADGRGARGHEAE